MFDKTGSRQDQLSQQFVMTTAETDKNDDVTEIF